MFKLGDIVRIQRSGELGQVVGLTELLEGRGVPQALVEGTSGNGCSFSSWFTMPELESPVPVAASINEEADLQPVPEYVRAAQQLLNALARMSPLTAAKQAAYYGAELLLDEHIGHVLRRIPRV